jgi:alpha-beta hydrolase superfamily lysophospholipase
MFSRHPEYKLGPQQKREHLYAFWKEHIGRPMVLSGCSLGGAIAIDFALAYPEVSPVLRYLGSSAGQVTWAASLS